MKLTERDVMNILLKDCCTMKEAEKHIKAGVMIYQDDADFKDFEAACSGMFEPDEIVDMWLKLDCVVYKNLLWRINYCL